MKTKGKGTTINSISATQSAEKMRGKGFYDDHLALEGELEFGAIGGQDEKAEGLSFAE
jgi:hypothetical protein